MDQKVKNRCILVVNSQAFAFAVSLKHFGTDV